jgi:uncharacterized membrane protein
MNSVSNAWLLRIYFGIAACSWMPHWACHYYRLETHSSFVVGFWAFSSTDSIVALLIYGGLVVLNLLAIQNEKHRLVAATVTGIGHLTIGLLHAFRLVYPFTFEVFGYPWSYGASLREAIISVPFALLSLLVPVSVNK